LRDATVEAHVFGVLDHTRLELQRVEAGGHAEESGVAFYDCLVIWHLPSIVRMLVK
jgi:hypothetical protein